MNLNEATRTLTPTSMKNERNFSMSGIFVTKQRPELSDTAINALWVLNFIL
jgi:hypothetical protein